jgi:TolA-binding protein
MGLGVLTNQSKLIMEGFTTLTLIGLLSAQEPPLSEIFFLDLGIAIEPAKGSEAYSRLVDKPSKEVSFKIKQVESGSIYMATNAELLSTLNRINNRIERLESSFKTEMNVMRQENVELKQALLSLQISKSSEFFVSTPTEDASPSLNVSAKDPPTVKPVTKQSTNFDQSIYMSGVFAYQREDYKTAIQKFSKLKLSAAPQKTAENILYWLADAYQKDGQYDEALSLLNQITTSGTLRIDDALINKGLLYRKMGNENLALLAFGNVVSHYPNSEYLRLAQMELKNSNGIK